MNIARESPITRSRAGTDAGEAPHPAAVVATASGTPPTLSASAEGAGHSSGHTPRAAPASVHGSGPHSLRRRRSRRNSRSRRQSSQGPPTASADVKQLPLVYLENCTQREFEIIMMISDILWERGDSPVGLLGTRLHAKTQDHNLPTHFKEAYGGLKKFVSRWPTLFVLHTDHRYNPKVGLLGWPKSLVYPSRPPTGAPFSAANGSGQGGARARRRRGANNKAFQTPGAGGRRPSGSNYATVPHAAYSPYAHPTQSIPHSHYGAPGGPDASLASHERGFALSPTRDRASTFSTGMPSPHAHALHLRPGLNMAGYGPPTPRMGPGGRPDFSFGQEDTEFGGPPMPPRRGRSPPRDMVVEVGDPFDDLEFQDYFLNGGRSHAASDPGPRPYMSDPMDYSGHPALDGYSRRHLPVAPADAVSPLSLAQAEVRERDGTIRRDTPSRNGTTGGGDDSDKKSTSSNSKGEGAAGAEGQTANGTSAAAEKEGHNDKASSSSANTSVSSSPSNKSRTSNTSANAPPGTPLPRENGVANGRSDASAHAAQALGDELRVHALKMSAQAKKPRSPAYPPQSEFAFMEEEEFYRDFSMTRARSHSYDVSLNHGGLPPSSPYYPHESPRRPHDPHARLPPLPPLTPTYGPRSGSGYPPLSAEEISSARRMARERAMMSQPSIGRPYSASSRRGDYMYGSSAGGDPYMPHTQPLPHRSGGGADRDESALSHAMSAMSLDHKYKHQQPGAGVAAPNGTTSPFDEFDGGRSRSVSSPIMPGGTGSVLSRNANGAGIGARNAGVSPLPSRSVLSKALPIEKPPLPHMRGGARLAAGAAVQK